MDTKLFDLIEFLRRRRAVLGLSTAEVARLSRKGGHKGISSGYVSLIETGQVQNASIEKLMTLARVYDVTYVEILAIAAGFKADDTAISEELLVRISSGYKGMSPEQKRQLDPLIDIVERECKRLQNNEK